MSNTLNPAIYKITSPTNKIYIGQSWNYKRRFRTYLNMSPNNKGQRVLHSSFLKHGVNNHKFEVLHFLPKDVSQIILDNYEILYWELYKSCNIEMLNITFPGKGGKKSEETKKRIGLANIGKHSSKHSKERIEKALEGRRKVVAEKGYWFTPEVIEKYKANLLKAVSNPSKETREKMRQAKLGTKHSKEVIEARMKKVRKPVIQLDLEGNFIKEWESAALAGKTINVNISAISQVCKGKQITCGNFKWVYKFNNN